MTDLATKACRLPHLGVFSTNSPPARRRTLTGSCITDPRCRSLRLLFFRLVFGSFPSVASAGLRLQCRWPGVKFALHETAAYLHDRRARTLGLADKQHAGLILGLVCRGGSGVGVGGELVEVVQGGGVVAGWCDLVACGL
ncbi:hypothetical protein [Catenulispora pinistramenti]|uniref:hypothetical protein n=1 Tax=Catenulispora pinistramenti TaxID=2705254 RepID=UPI001BA87692|nr:hypothetical protein [Catenulispora pinistramenti]